jgi:glutathione synthase/RimK-type ligase-like ATP-grasp enzyme
MVLILTQGADPHTDVVLQRLRERGVPVTRFNTGDMPETARAVIRRGQHENWAAIALDGTALSLAEVRSVWWRRPEPPRLSTVVPEQERSLAAREASHFLMALWDCLADQFWVNPYAAQRSARHKIQQLGIARMVGLDVPRTIITNRPDQVSAFFDRCRQRMIFKPFEANRRVDRSGRASGIYTSLVTADDVKARSAQVALSPCLFQEYLEPAAEIRVTAIGSRMFAASTDGHRDHEQQPDSRRRLGDAVYRHFDLSPMITAQLQDLMRRLNLVFGCIDLILTPEGRVVFLEVNPSGQWYGMEQHTGQPLCEHLVAMLDQATPDYLI